MNTNEVNNYGLAGKQGEALEGIMRLAVSGELAVGSSFSEAEVADHLGTSRTPVRQAVAVLAFSGLLAVEPQVGTSLVIPETKELKQLEGIIALGERRVVYDIKGSKVLSNDRKIGDSFALVEESLTGETIDVDAFLKADTDYHRTLSLLADNDTNAHITTLWGLKRRMYRVGQPELTTEQVHLLAAADMSLFVNITENVPGIGQYAVDNYHRVVRDVELS